MSLIVQSHWNLVVCDDTRSGLPPSPSPSSRPPRRARVAAPSHRPVTRGSGRPWLLELSQKPLWQEHSDSAVKPRYRDG